MKPMLICFAEIDSNSEEIGKSLKNVDVAPKETEHKTVNEKQWNCSLCSFTANCEKDLHEHSKVHPKRRPYVCNVCGRAYSLRQYLVRHMLKHEGLTFS